MAEIIKLITEINKIEIKRTIQKIKWNKELVLWDNQQDRQYLIQINQKTEKVSKLRKWEPKWGHKNRYQRISNNHKNILSKPVIHQIGNLKKIVNFLDSYKLTK